MKGFYYVLRKYLSTEINLGRQGRRMRKYKKLHKQFMTILFDKTLLMENVTWCCFKSNFRCSESVLTSSWIVLWQSLENVRDKLIEVETWTTFSNWCLQLVSYVSLVSSKTLIGDTAHLPPHISFTMRRIIYGFLNIMA